MNVIYESFKEAIKLLFSFDKNIYDIVLLSMFVSLTATFFASIFGVILGVILGITKFRGRRFIVQLVYTFMSVPPVIVGLVVFLFISRNGPFGFLQLIYTPPAMIIAQFFLVLPIMIGYSYNVSSSKGIKVLMLHKTLGGNSFSGIFLLIKELRLELLGGVVSSYGRAISEMGAVMIVGGNIAGHTRVMTTNIAMLQSMGEYPKAIALGIVLLSMSFIVQTVLLRLQKIGN